MRYLNRKENKLFENKIGLYGKKTLKKLFEKEFTFKTPSAKFISKLGSFCKLRKITTLLVYPDNTWSLYETKFNNKPVLIESREVRQFLKENIEISTEDYYIIDGKLDFKWLIIICNEGDYHIMGDKKFVKSTSLFFK